MGDNYKAWNLDYKDFYKLTDSREKLKFLLRFALLAPSSHNSQPWRFRLDGNKICILPEDERALPMSDANNRQLFISLGAALENILVAAEFYGYKASVNVLNIALEEFPGLSQSDEGIIKSIISRRTNRNKYYDRELPLDFLNYLQSLSGDGLSVQVVSGGGVKNKIIEIVSDALIEAMDDNQFRFELAEYIKTNITKSKIGMPMFGFGMPTLPSLIAPFLLRRFNLNRLSRKQDEALLKNHTPYFVIISSIGDSKEDWIKSGRLFESIALMAERGGIGIAPMAAVIEIGEHHKKLQNILNTNHRPQVFFRIGYPVGSLPAHSPRLNLEDITYE